MRQMSENPKRDAPRQNRRERIQRRHNCRISVNVVRKSIVGRVHDDVTEADGERKEHLSYGRIPHFRLQNLVPLWRQKIRNSVPSTLQRNRPYQQNQHDKVREQSQKVRRLARTTNTFDENRRDTHPGQHQTTQSWPIWPAYTVVYAVFFFEYGISALLITRL
jgi:hypothetical protein